MFFNKQSKPKTEQQIIKDVVKASNDDIKQRNLSRLATIAATLDDKEGLSHTNPLALTCEAMELFKWIDANIPLHDLECGLVLSSEWCLRKHKNKPLTFEYSEN